MVANRNKLTLTVLMILGIIIIATIAIICYSNYKKVDPVATQAISQVIYPLFSATPFPVPDSLQYYYNTIESRGIALSGGEFFVKIKHPVFRSDKKEIKKLEKWLSSQIFILALQDIPEIEDKPAFFGNNYAAYANETLNSWLSYEESTYTGCIQESLAVEIVLNSSILTLMVSHGGYWGGAHGDTTTKYTMFDKYYNVVTLQSVIEPSKQTDFQNMMVREYDLQVDPFRDYDDDYKSNPESCGLISHGLISQYSSYDYAEGNPQVFIPASRIEPFLKKEYRDVFRKQGLPNER